jgi:drug/metabolite transporter (DMT)-like permease
MAVLAAAVLSTGLAMVVYYRLLATVGSIAMSSQAYLRIVVGVGLGVAFLGERPTAHALVGLGLVMAGVVAMTWPGRRVTPRAR